MQAFSHKPVGGRPQRRMAWRWFLLPASSMLAMVLAPYDTHGEATAAPPHVSVDRSGELRVSNGMTLRLSIDLGSVRVETLPPNAPPSIRYSVHLETDATGSAGQRLLDGYALTTRETIDTVLISGALPTQRLSALQHRPVAKTPQFWVQFVISVPAVFNVEVSTGAGDIQTTDIGGRAVLVSQGGNISAGRIGSVGPQGPHNDRLVAKIVTQAGGHITLRDVNGDADVYTGGGHIIAGNIEGNAKLTTGGGNIRAARIKGTASLDTAGGNIAVGEAGSLAAVRTAGGQIDFGEVHGSVRAQTGGGGIRVMYVSGPMEVATSGGSICLTRVANAVHAETGEGKIIAWINPEDNERGHNVRLSGPSQLASRTGDIAVFLPRNISVTIDATVDSGGPARIEADPSLPLNIQTRPDGPVHAMATLNGGGAPLRLHTTGGRIQLQFLDSQISLRQSLMDEQRQRLEEKFKENGMVPVAWSTATSEAMTPPAPPPSLDSKDSWFDTARKQAQAIFMGSIREDAEDFKRRLTVAPAPVYPQLARKAGVQGLVALEVRIKADGSVAIDKVAEGEPSLAEAAIAAVQKWRGNPAQVNGKNVEVVSTIRFRFELSK